MYSYFINAGNIKLPETQQVAKNLFDKTNAGWNENLHTQIIIRDSAKFCQNEGKEYFLAGKVDNLHRLAGSNVNAGAKEIDVCISLIKKHGLEAINQWKGCFAFIINDPVNNMLQYTIGNTGLMQGYMAVQNDRVLITSELKAFRHTTLLERKMIPISEYKYDYFKPVEEDFCFIENIKRVIPGYMYSIDYSNADEVSVQKKELEPIRSVLQKITKEEAKEKIFFLLDENVQDKIHTKKTAVPVSGGVDSGVVASLVSRHSENIYTCTIGTDFGNEFDNAKELHMYLHSQHEEIHIDEPGFWEGFLQSVWHNEICDPLYAEGYVGFYHTFKKAQEHAQQIFTGYGADLILGDFLLISDRSSINSFSERWCRRTAWSGEMSPYLAHTFSLELQHPFWEIELINLSLSLPYEYKYLGDEVKAVLREMAEEKKLLPAEIAWRKKNAFTTGASLDKLFSHCLDISDAKNYQIKSIFLYYLFEELFVYDKDISEIDIQQLITKTKMYAR